jgi:VanZ family protein
VRKFWRIGFALHLSFVTAIIVMAYLGMIPNIHAVVPFKVDTFGHALLIGLLAFFLDGSLGFKPVSSRTPWIRLGPVIVLVLAGAEELAQALSPNRTCSITDFAGDVIGVVLFSWLARWLDSRLKATPAK